MPASASAGASALIQGVTLPQRASLWLVLSQGLLANELMGEEFPGLLHPPVSASRGTPAGGRAWTSPSFSRPAVGRGTGPAFVAQPRKGPPAAPFPS